MECDSEEYLVYWKAMVEVRDKAIAHQDMFDEIPSPMLDKAFAAVCYYVDYIYENEILDGITIQYRCDPKDTYVRYQRWGAAFWNGADPTPEDRKLLVLRTVKLEDN